MNWRTNEPLIQPSSTPSSNLTGHPLAADFSLSPTSGRLEQLQVESRAILRKHLAREEYDFLIEMSKRPDQNSLTREERNRAASLMAKVQAQATPAERAKLAELKDFTKLRAWPGK